GYHWDSASTADEGLRKLTEGLYDLVLLDINLPDRSGLEVLRSVKHENPLASVIMITAYDSSQVAFEASKEGADSYITKPWDNDKLAVEIRNLLDKSRLQVENIQLRRALKRYGLPNIVGRSEPMQKVFDLITQVAPSRATVLILGESGTGKELVAKTIHATSTRADRSFVPVNTGSMPSDLLESTLFGHVKGAFTSAVATKRGLFELADQGTIFFDEIGTIGLETQAKLLRVIQEREFMRLGGTETIKVDVRILAATNADLHKLVAEGRFREDLYYRLNVISVPLPPLRSRKEDIPHLLDHFLKKFGKENGRDNLRFTPEALKALMDHDWPGNVRELENAVERAVVLASGPALGRELLPEPIVQNGSHVSSRLNTDGMDGMSLFEITEAFERQVILEMLARTHWSQTEAAERFKIPLSTLNQKIRRLQIDIKRRRNN
ncbi:MAG: sigma-54-dependent transcriptional regulator, partial [Terriglobia bacterium]